MPSLKYLSAYPEELQSQIQLLIEKQELGQYLLARYPTTHSCNNDKQLRLFVMALKNQHLKRSAPLSKIEFNTKLHVINNALGTHSYITRVQGKKLKTTNEIRISSLFKKVPEAFLNMIVVHELAHIKEKDHSAEFYKLCRYMLPDYHQLEFDLRVYLTALDLGLNLY